MVFRPNKLGLVRCLPCVYRVYGARRASAGQWPGGAAAAAPCLSVFPCLLAAAADKVVNGSLFALPVDRGVNNNYFNNSRLLPFTECLMRQLNRSQTFQNVHTLIKIFWTKPTKVDILYPRCSHNTFE